jgi:SWI/SNF-related matrix-associated actin-dependent regulator 1 of chromatin subfamily A
MPSAGLSFGRFAARYCAPKPSSLPGVPVDYTGASCLAELNLVLSRTVLIRRTNEDVKDTDALPPKRRSVVSLELDAASLQRVARLKAKLDGLRERGDEVGGRALMSEYYALTGREKSPAACQYVQELLLHSPDAKLLVFAHHQGVLDAIESGPLAAVKYVRVDGTTSHKARSDRVDAFQTDPSVRVALLSVTAAGVGITLTAASTVVFAELVWAPGPLRQAEDRAHRVGQTRQVTVQYLLAQARWMMPCGPSSRPSWASPQRRWTGRLRAEAPLVTPPRTRRQRCGKRLRGSRVRHSRERAAQGEPAASVSSMTTSKSSLMRHTMPR